MITFEFQRTAQCSYWYAMRRGNCIAHIAKFDDRRGDINPFKVSFKVAGEFRPHTCFWPHDCPTEQGGYFKNCQGGLLAAKDLVKEVLTN